MKLLSIKLVINLLEPNLSNSSKYLRIYLLSQTTLIITIINATPILVVIDDLDDRFMLTATGLWNFYLMAP